ncbi:hypothetical protein [Nocardia colli]|uniref:hypothetical protein n=1 Tax=Nocardia colli TaxID=2545717 RepID=UPI0035D911D9
MPSGQGQTPWSSGRAKFRDELGDHPDVRRRADADPVGVEGFLTAFRLVGCVYLIGNAIGILALRRRPSPWLFWLIFAVNATQAVGLKAVPAEMFTAARDEFGWPGMLPSLITDGGAALLAIILLATYAVTHTTWGQVRR